MSNWAFPGFQWKFRFKRVLMTVPTRKRRLEQVGGQLILPGLSAAVQIQAGPDDSSYQKRRFEPLGDQAGISSLLTTAQIQASSGDSSYRNARLYPNSALRYPPAP